MGYAITWCAIREANAERFLRTLALSPTGEASEEPDSLISSAKLDTGWRLIWYNKYGCPFLAPTDLRRISTDYDVLLCLVDEHVMASSAELWSGGDRKWWLSHEGEDGPKGLEVEGEPPDSFPAIKREMEKLQAENGGDKANVDYLFEIPLKVAHSSVGFKHDEDCEHLVGNEFIALSRVQQSRNGGFLRRLFGK
jgi:hypothetical protein